ncbi:unnamed protein product [Choristocarpus tenellus]
MYENIYHLGFNYSSAKCLVGPCRLDTRSMSTSFFVRTPRPISPHLPTVPSVPLTCHPHPPCPKDLSELIVREAQGSEGGIMESHKGFESEAWWVDSPLSPEDLQSTNEPRTRLSRCTGWVWKIIGTPVVLLLAWTSFSGWTFVAELALQEGINSLALTLERQLVAVPAMLWFAHWNKGDLLPRGADTPMIIILGALGFGNIVGAIEALKYVDAGAVALGQLCVPVATVCFCWLFGAEQMSKLKVASILVCVAGAMLVSVFYNEAGGYISVAGTTGSRLWWVGVLLLTVHVVCAAGLAVGLSDIVRRYHPASVTAWYYIVGTVFTLFACIFSNTQLRDFGLKGRAEPWIAIVYGALVVSFFNWNAISWAIARLPASVVMASGTSRPLLTALLALWIHNDKLGVVEWVGSVMIGVGLLLLHIAHHQEEAEEDLTVEREQYLQGERKPLLEEVMDV